MNVREYTESIGTAPPPLVILFCPSKAPKAREASYEPFLVERAVERLVETYVDPSMRDLVYTVFHADEAKPADIALEAQTLPFLAERRVIVVRNAERYHTEAAGGPVLSYLDNPNDTTLMILIAAQVDKRTKLYKACGKSGLIVECPRLNKRELAKWVRNEVEKREKTVEPAAVEEIVRRSGDSLSDVNNALSIVLDYIGEGQTVREADVIAACADVAEEEIWALTNAIAASKPGAAITALRKLVDLGKHEDQILGTINWLVKCAYTVRRGNTGPTAISPYQVKKIQPLADKYPVHKWRDAFALCTDTQFMMRSTGVDGLLMLELLVVKLAAPRRRQRAAR